ncbi:Calcium-binding protein CML42 [Zostera marina]|uniref:Calcium-binding protein CML42 n=1 Tax=Zostera marina TaxID=29655 RepID=A0A0K9NMG4_ZOSMR|nr:Calcium-binding protein CML42 [Zostera marina]
MSFPAPSFQLRNQSLNTIRIQRTFDVFDTNKDGELTVSEICQAFAKMGLKVDRLELLSTVSNYFKPNRTGLDFEGFLDLYNSIGEDFFGGGEDYSSNGKEAEMEEDLKAAFDVFDENNDGFISALELQRVLEKLGMVEGNQIKNVKDMICSVDSNQDGMVDINEFKHMMEKL